MPLQLACNEYPIDAPADRFIGTHELDHRPTRRLDQDAGRPGNRPLRARPTRQQTHFTKEITGLKLGRQCRISRRLQRYRPLNNGEERGSILSRLIDRVTFANDPRGAGLPTLLELRCLECLRFARLVHVVRAVPIGHADFTFDDEFPKRECIELVEHRNSTLELFEHRVRITEEWNPGKLPLDQLLIDWFDTV